MSRRRKGDRHNGARVHIVCTGRETHKPFRFGSVIVDAADDPFGFATERVETARLDQAMRAHVGAERPWGRQMEGEGTRTFPCPRCADSTPIRHQRFCEKVCGAADAGVGTLDISFPDDMLPTNST